MSFLPFLGLALRSGADDIGTVPRMAVDLVIDIENSPGALAEVAAAISDAGVNIAAATCIGTGDRAELHILVKHAEAAGTRWRSRTSRSRASARSWWSTSRTAPACSRT